MCAQEPNRRVFRYPGTRCGMEPVRVCVLRMCVLPKRSWRAREPRLSGAFPIWRASFGLTQPPTPNPQHQTPSPQSPYPLNPWSSGAAALGFRVQGSSVREIGNLLPNERRQRRTCYALCHILYPVSAAQTSIFRMDSNSTSYILVSEKRV